MPRKTRKHKERTTTRRQRVPAPNGGTATHSGVVKREFEFSFTELAEPANATIKNKQSDKSFYFYQSASVGRDLVKTVVLATIIFSLEVVIYFAWFRETGPGYEIYNLINEQVIKLF